MVMPAAVGAMFWLERRFDGFGGRAQLIEHGLENVIAEQAQPVRVRFSGDYVAELSSTNGASCLWCVLSRC